MSNPSLFVAVPGLENVVAGETAVATLEGGLHYRGYPIGELVRHCTYDEVAYLLLHGELPTIPERLAFLNRLKAHQKLPAEVSEFLRNAPKDAHAMDVLRTAVSMLAFSDPDVGSNDRDADLRKSERLLVQISVAVAELDRARRGLEPIPSRLEQGIAANLLWMLRGEAPPPFDRQALDASLILYAEHEFNASTFTIRVILSTEADLHSAVIGAIGALKGRLHGGANERIMETLNAIGSAENAEPWLRSALSRKERVMGFGHRVVRTGDIRAGILADFARTASERADMGHLEAIAATLERILAAEKNLHPNVDWPAGRLYHALGLSPWLATPLFVAARIAGWCAHALEQTANNRLIRPRSHYTGPAERHVVPIVERSDAQK
ncbi:MAG: citrate synthase [Gemmataceae bacterium]|nr:citrate synthase [Gemmataceae bacterium]